MAQPPVAKVLVVGSVNGHLAEFFAKVKKLDAKHGPFSVLLVTGNLFADRSLEGEDEEIGSLLRDEIAVPVMTYAIVGDRGLPRRVSERAARRSGEICSNLAILPGQGVLQTSEGVRIAYISGRYGSQSTAAPQAAQDVGGSGDGVEGAGAGSAPANGSEAEAAPADGSGVEDVATTDLSGEPGDTSSDVVPSCFDGLAISDLLAQVASENEKAFQKTQAQPSIDILLTFDWPYGVVPTPFSGGPAASQPATQFASNKVSLVCAAAMPRYHFAAGEGIFYERQPWRYGNRVAVGRGPAAAPHYTRFVGLGSANESKHGKQRWFYAMNVQPLHNASSGTAAPGSVPEGCTANPLFRFGKLGKALDTRILPKILAGVDGNGDDSDDDGRHPSAGGQGRRRAAPPPLSYVCHSCNQPGHWISDCPTKDQQKRRRTDNAAPPPPDYVCRGCSKPGHWRSDCPDDGDGGARAQPTDALAKCWFCLANPDVDQNLMAAIGDEAYVAMAKGALVVGGAASSGFEGFASPIPGGGHVLVVPIVHTDSLRRTREGASEEDRGLGTEIDRWTAAITALFAEYDCVPLAFETSRCLPHVHTALQMVPIPKAKAGAVRPTLEELCAAEGLAVERGYPAAPRDGYFVVGDPDADDSLFVHIPRHAKGFNLELGRRLAATILGVPAREHWRQCVVAEAEEARERDRFIAAFAKHDFAR
ncbi:hypothetical protein LPJ61_002567 [Coemansia biformis]|uniref:CCHC-type domain-containing protein n=1 Tax=Coemansia biformis TaxID=1286918 RepID=A0A9W7YD38_9FUNG|nr:hypothetical protein LPJ61_002567 [Coemansia biformis]